jgi:hypothetical protein
LNLKALNRPADCPAQHGPPSREGVAEAWLSKDSQTQTGTNRLGHWPGTLKASAARPGRFAKISNI